MTPHTKNPHAVSLGKLGGRKPGFTGKPLDPAKARAMVASRWAKYRANKAWNRCDVCGQFIPISDFDNGATRKLITPDSDRSSEQYETLCKIHTRANKQTTQTP